MTAGIGTITVTFVSALAKMAVSTLAVSDNSMTGTAPTLAVAETTPGVDATGRGAGLGRLLVDTTNAKLYIATASGSTPTWVVVGTQT
jgi:hypothetical protein